MCGTGWPAAAANRAAGNDAQAFGLTLLGGFEQQLHPETHAEYRLFERSDHGVQGGLAQSLHRVRGRAHARQNHVAGASDSSRIGAHLARRLQPLECEAERCDVGATACDDHDVAGGVHSMPFVVGKSTPSSLMA
jgi:hypothetical protein